MHSPTTVNTVTASFNTIMGQITEMSQRRKKQFQNHQVLQASTPSHQSKAFYRQTPATFSLSQWLAAPSSPSLWRSSATVRGFPLGTSPSNSPARSGLLPSIDFALTFSEKICYCYMSLLPMVAVLKLLLKWGKSITRNVRFARSPLTWGDRSKKTS